MFQVKQKGGRIMKIKKDWLKIRKDVKVKNVVKMEVFFMKIEGLGMRMKHN